MVSISSWQIRECLSSRFRKGILGQLFNTCSSRKTATRGPRSMPDFADNYLDPYEPYEPLSKIIDRQFGRVAEKASAKKASAKKAPAKQALAVKKTKSMKAKKAAAKSAPVKKAPVKKAPVKKATKKALFNPV